LRQGARVCPHCGAENPVSALVTLCRRCRRALDSAAAGSVLPPPVPMPSRSPGFAAEPLPSDIGSPTDEALADPSPPLSVSPPSVEPSAYASWPFTLPIWLHLPLSIIATMAGFLGGAAFMGIRGPHLLPHWIPMPIGFFGGAILGLLSAKLIFGALILGRCPKCDGAARMKSGRPMTYTCQVCGHVHRTSVSGG